MTVLRHYFISDSLADLEHVEKELEAKGVSTPQIHVLSEDTTGVANHTHLHEVSPFMKHDVIRTGVIGAIIGTIAGSIVMLISYLSGWTESAAGWVPTLFFAGLLACYCTWQGGFIGIQTPNKHFKRFEKELAAGKHLFFVDLMPAQEGILETIVKDHPRLEIAGTARGTPHWVMEGQNRVPKLLQETLP